MNVSIENAGSPQGVTGDLAANKRKTARFALLIRSAKLVSSHGEFLCIVKDVSEEGLKLKLFHPLPPCDSLQIEISSGHRFPVELRWQNDGIAGFQFVNPIDVHNFISEASPYPKRPLRLRLDCPALIEADRTAFPARICDLSREGTRIETQALLAIGERLTLTTTVMPRLVVNVRWRRSPTYGLVFSQILSFEELALIAARIQLPEWPADSPIPGAPVARRA